MDIEKARKQLVERLTENYADYQSQLLLKDRQELIDGAGKIADTAETFQHLMARRYTEEELSYLLKFQNPLEVVADHWENFELSPDVFEMVVADVLDKQDDHTLYPLAANALRQKPDGLQKFMNVDLEKALPQIMAQITAFYQSDLQYALKAMRLGIRTDDPAKRNFVVLFRNSGVACLNERSMLVAGSDSYQVCQSYHTQIGDPVLAYSVELLGDGSKGLRGNLYQQDNHQLARFAERVASPITDITVTFQDGNQVCVPLDQFQNTISGLVSRHGEILERRNEAEDESVVQGALRREHNRREKLPKGKFPVHVQALAESRLQVEADRLTTALQKQFQAAMPDKADFKAEVSIYFVPLASNDEIHRLFKMVEAQVNRPMYIERADNHRMYFHARGEERKQEHCPSIKEKLAAEKSSRAQRVESLLQGSRPKPTQTKDAR